MRELAYEEGPGSSCFVALTYIIDPPALGEQKSKAAQLGIKQVMQLGIQPDIIVCRATSPGQREGPPEDQRLQQCAARTGHQLARFDEHLQDPGHAPRPRDGLRRPATAQDRGPDQPAARAKGLGQVVRFHGQDRGRQVRDDDRHYGQVHLRPRQLCLDHQRPGARGDRLGLRCEDQVDRDDFDHGRQRREAFGRRRWDHCPRRVRGPRLGGQDRLREVRPREQSALPGAVSRVPDGGDRVSPGPSAGSRTPAARNSTPSAANR